MCLIALAHRASERYPLVIAANRDEDHERPSREAHFWEDAPDVLGGRDLLQGGSWLAISRGGRFAAVTNLRGATSKKHSRGFLVSSFVKSGVASEDFRINADDYAGFHLLIGEAGGNVVYYENGVLSPGVYGFSNAGSGEHWPKVDIAIAHLTNALDAGDLCNDLLQFLKTPRNTGRVEEEVFIVCDRYGTRSSTVIIATMSEIVFAEQNYARGGIATGEPRVFRFPRL